MSPAIRVVIADDHPIIIDGLQKLLVEATAITVAGTARSFPELITLLTRVEVDVLVLDLKDMGGSPLALMNRLQLDYPELNVLIYSSMIDFAPEMFEAGARGYVTKEEPTTEVAKAITAVAHGELFISPLVQEYLDLSTKETTLTSKEQTVIKLLAQGLSTREIAEQMRIHLHTAQNHITALRRKTGSIQRTQVVEWYHRVYGKRR